MKTKLPPKSVLQVIGFFPTLEVHLNYFGSYAHISPFTNAHALGVTFIKPVHAEVIVVNS